MGKVDLQNKYSPLLSAPSETESDDFPTYVTRNRHNLKPSFKEQLQTVHLQRNVNFLQQKLVGKCYAIITNDKPEHSTAKKISPKTNIKANNTNSSTQTKGGFPVMAKITRILAANIPRQFFFVITTTASTRCLVQNFQLICYSQRVNATSQYNDSGSSRCSKWPKDRMVAVVQHCWLLVQGKEASEKDNQRQLLDRCSRKYWHVR